MDLRNGIPEAVRLPVLKFIDAVLILFSMYSRASLLLAVSITMSFSAADGESIELIKETGLPAFAGNDIRFAKIKFFLPV